MNVPLDRKPEAQAKPNTAVVASPTDPGAKRLLQPDSAARARFFAAALAGPKDTKWKSG